MKKILLVLSTALFALIFVFGLVSTVSAADESVVSEAAPAAIPSTGCYNFANDLYYGINRWKGYPSLVTKLQTILKGNESASISDKTGVFGVSTAQAVSNFQEKYKSDILTPNNLTNGTGIVDLLTRQTLNQKYGCINKASVTLTAPVGKLVYSIGEKVMIKWNASLIPNTTDLKISYVGVSSKATTTINTVSKVKNGAGLYEWTIPDSLTKGEYKLLIELAGSVKSAQSVQAFTIQEKSASITYPNNGEEFNTESPIQIKWSKGSSVPTAAYAVIKLQKVGLTGAMKIGESALTTGMINYTPTQTGEYSVLIEVYAKKSDSSDPSKVISQDSSDKTIKISGRDLTLTKPTAYDLGGIKPGSEINVGWKFNGKVSNANIYLVGNGATTTLLANTVGGTASEKIAKVKILTTQKIGSNYKIVVESVDKKYSVSSPSFAITSGSAGITVSNPVANSAYKIGETINVEWNSSNLNGLKVALYKGETLMKDSICIISNVSVTNCSYKIPTNDVKIVEGTDYNFVVYSSTNSSIKGKSSNFKIELGSGVVLDDFSSPIEKGKTKDITWGANGDLMATTNLNIDLIKDGKATRLVSNIKASDKKWTWNVPIGQVSGNYSIKIYSTTNATIFSEKNLAVSGQSITVTSPVAGNTAKLGSNLEVKWTNTGVVAAVKIELVNSETKAVTTIPNTGNTGSKSWLVPTTQTPGKYKVVVTYTTDTSVKDESEEFNIASDSGISLNTLVSSIEKGKPIEISWQTNGILPGAYVKVDITKDGKPVTTSGNLNLKTVTKWTWNVPATQAAGNYSVKVYSVTNTALSSTKEFSVVGQTITVTSPTSASTVKLGSNLDIRWTNTGGIAAVKIELVNSETKAVTTIPNTGNTGSKSWLVPTTQTPGKYKVVVTYTTDTSVKDESEEFTVGTGMSITLEPLSNTSYFRGDSIYINWIANNVSTIKIELLNKGVLSRAIVASLAASANGGSYKYTIPSTLATSSDYSIRVTSINPNNASIKAESSTFSVLPLVSITAPTSGSLNVPGNLSATTSSSSTLQPSSTSSVTGPVSLNQNLKPGTEGPQVTALQQALKQIGLYSGEITGFFGDLTKKSVMKFQTANALDAVGEVGPKTRDLLNFVLSR